MRGRDGTATSDSRSVMSGASSVSSVSKMTEPQPDRCVGVCNIVSNVRSGSCRFLLPSYAWDTEEALTKRKQARRLARAQARTRAESGRTSRRGSGKLTSLLEGNRAGARVPETPPVSQVRWSLRVDYLAGADSTGAGGWAAVGVATPAADLNAHDAHKHPGFFMLRLDDRRWYWDGQLTKYEMKLQHNISPVRAGDVLHFQYDFREGTLSYCKEAGPETLRLMANSTDTMPPPQNATSTAAVHDAQTPSGTAVSSSRKRHGKCFYAPKDAKMWDYKKQHISIDADTGRVVYHDPEEEDAELTSMYLATASQRGYASRGPIEFDWEVRHPLVSVSVCNLRLHSLTHLLMVLHPRIRCA